MDKKKIVINTDQKHFFLIFESSDLEFLQKLKATILKDRHCQFKIEWTFLDQANLTIS